MVKQTAENGIGKGTPGPGRPKGSSNKTTTLAKEAIALAFDQMGGTGALVTWANTNDDTRKAFYTQVWPKIIPLQVNGAGDDGEHVHKVVREIVRPQNTDR